MTVLDPPDLTDDSDADDVDGVMIALLPTTSDWCKIDLPHLTLVYAGLVKDMSPGDLNELTKDASAVAMMANPLSLRVVEKTTFGDAEKVDVFRLMPTMDLWAMRRAVDEWDKSDFDFNPHVTIGPAGTPVDFTPQYIGFDQLVVVYGTDILPFRLQRGGY